MYNLPDHKENNHQRIVNLINQYPFASLIGTNSNLEPVCTQLPLFLDKSNGMDVLRGHIMKNSDHHNAFLNNQNVLAVFTGPNAYVSATWYSVPGIASTWNYMSVHVRGKIGFLDFVELEDVLRKTTLHFENYDEKTPVSYDNLPSEFKQRYMNAIVGFEVRISSIDNVFKLSQNRDYKSYENIISELQQGDYNEQGIASEMAIRRNEVFPDR